MCATEARVFPRRRPLFYYITDRRTLPDRSLLRTVRRAIRWGVDFVQVREKDLCDRDLFELTREIVGSARGSRCRVLVNGRADIALAAGAGGVHLPSVGILASDIRPWLPKGFTVGVSTHSARQAARAAAAQADYVLFGPLFPTDSKLGYGPPLGLEPLRRLCRSLPIPVLGLGGIHPQQVSLVLGAGAAGVAGISLFQNDACFRGLESLPAGRAGIYRERRGPDPQQ